MSIYNIKGFIEIPSFVSNTANTTAPMGELSLYSETYTLDRLHFSNDDKDVSNVVVFNSVIDTTPAVVPQAAVDKVQDIMELAHVSFSSSISFQDQLVAAFPELTDVTTGGLVTYLGIQYPTFIEFTFPSADDTITMKMWISDTSFRAEYDLHVNKPITRTANVTDLHGTFESVQAALGAVSFSQYIQKIGLERGGFPTTTEEPVTLMWQDPTNNENAIPIDFIVLVYGIAGLTQDNLHSSIREYLVANSDKTIEEWVTYFPELLNVDRLTFLPQWDNVAVAATSGGVTFDTIYSPVMNYNTVMTNIRKVYPDATLTELRPLVDLTSLVYKTLGLVVVGDASNGTGRTTFGPIYPDYTTLPVNDINLNRISAITISCIHRLGVMVRIAEEDTGTEVLPVGYTRTTLGEVNYIEAIENSIIFRMATKATYKALVA